jgi:hypothetical protein
VLTNGFGNAAELVVRRDRRCQRAVRTRKARIGADCDA